MPDDAAKACGPARPRAASVPARNVTTTSLVLFTNIPPRLPPEPNTELEHFVRSLAQAQGVSRPDLHYPCLPNWGVPGSGAFSVCRGFRMRPWRAIPRPLTGRGRPFPAVKVHDGGRWRAEPRWGES